VILAAAIVQTALDFYHLTQVCSFSACPELVQRELQHAGIMAILGAIVIGWYIQERKAAKKLDRRRQAAARGEGRLISRDLELRSLRL